MAGQLNEIPASLEPIAELQLGDKTLKVYVTSVWYKFFVSLSDVLTNLIGGVLGFTNESNVTAAGASQATAYALTTEWAEVTTVPVGAGVALNNFGAGVPSTVMNASAGLLNVYPPLGGQIDALGVNNPYPLAATKTQIFNQSGSGQWRSTQLG